MGISRKERIQEEGGFFSEVCKTGQTFCKYFSILKVLKVLQSDKVEMVKCFSFNHIFDHSQDKVTFFSTRTSPNISHFPRQVDPRRFLSILVRETRKRKYFLLSLWHTGFTHLVRDFLLFDEHEHTHGIVRSVILVSKFTLWVYLTFSLFLKIWLTESVLLFRE